MSDETESKWQEVVKLFACYPSMATMDAKQARLTLGAYLEKLTGVSADELGAACRLISSRRQPFPPSAGELLHECLDVRAKRRKADADSVPRLEYRRPIDTLSPEEREASKKRVADIIAGITRRRVEAAE